MDYAYYAYLLRGGNPHRRWVDPFGYGPGINAPAVEGPIIRARVRVQLVSADGSVAARGAVEGDVLLPTSGV